MAARWKRFWIVIAECIASGLGYATWIMVDNRLSPVDPTRPFGLQEALTTFLILAILGGFIGVAWGMFLLKNEKESGNLTTDS